MYHYSEGSIWLLDTKNKKTVINVKAKWICILKYASTRETTTGHSALQFFAFEINDQRLI